MTPTQIKIPSRLTALHKPKRFKVIIGGRGSAKSESVAALFAAMVYQSGCRAVCCREFQKSIDQSVHSLIGRKINDLSLDGFRIMEQKIRHSNGGEIIYQGLARDPEAIKSVDDAELCWVEEAQSLSAESLEKLTPSIRGKGAEIWFTANLGRSTDPFSQRFIKPYEKELRANGYYEDDQHLIIWINHWDNPWFPGELEGERLTDKERMSAAEYAHKWEGEFADSVPNSIIMPDWFDACIDAHVTLGIRPLGMEVLAHDPSDNGADAKGLAFRRGNVFFHVDEMATGDINEGGDWAIEEAYRRKPDVFIWDGDGMGAGLRRQFNDALGKKRIVVEMFRGSSSPTDPDKPYEAGIGQPKTNRQTFRNRRAQAYWEVRDRVYDTYRAIRHGDQVDRDRIISFSSTIKKMDMLRSELCSVPRKPNSQGLIQIMSKDDMLRQGIASPNMADAVMMAMAVTDKALEQPKPLINRARLAVGDAVAGF